MKKFLLICVGLILCSSAYAYDTFRFAELAWGDSPENVTNQMTAKGYALTNKSANGDEKIYVFESALFSSKANAYLFFVNDRLLRVDVRLFVDQPDVIKKFVEVRESLKKKYGAGVDQIGVQPAYYMSDGDEGLAKAISVGKGCCDTYWEDQIGEHQVRLIAIVQPSMTVDIIYETLQWRNYNAGGSADGDRTTDL